MTESVIMSLRMSVELRAALSEAAAADYRTVSSLITKILNEWLREHGEAPDDDQAVVHALPRGRPRRQSTGEGVHPWTSMIENWLDGRDRTTTDEVLEGAMKFAPSEATIAHRKGVELVLSELGYRKVTERKIGAEDQVIWARL